MCEDSKKKKKEKKKPDIPKEIKKKEPSFCKFYFFIFFGFNRLNKNFLKEMFLEIYTVIYKLVYI